MTAMSTSNQVSRLVIAGLVVIGASRLAIAQAGWTAPVNVDNSHERFSGHSAMDLDADGFVHAVWSDFSGSDVRVRYATNRSGSWIKSDVPLPGLSGGRNNCCLIVTPDETIHIFMQADGASPVKTHAWELTKPVSGGSWSAPLRISHDDGGNFDWAVEDATGGILAVWVTITFGAGGGANYCRYQPLGGAWGAVEFVEQGWGHDWPGDNYIAVGAGDRFYISYHVDRPYYRVRDAGVIGPRREVSSDGLSPRLAESPTGELAVAWHDNWRNWVKTSTDRGATWSSAMDMSTSPSYLDRNPVLGFDANGDLHVAWQKMFDGAGSDTYFRSRINGAWQAEYSLSLWDRGNSYPSRGSLNPRGADVHMLFPADYAPDDFYDIVYMNRPGSVEPQPPVIDELTLDHPLLIADDATQHTLTLQASDINGASDMTSLRFLVNYQGDHAGQHRGYVAWGATPADIGRYDAVENWSIQPVDAGDGYWGIHTTNWGGDDYLTIRNVAESTFGYKRTVVFTFSVKPRYHVDGPLADNDISVFADDAASSTGWQNHDLNFAIYPLPRQLPDPDRDTDIDQVDFGPFQVCLSGEFQAPGPGCEWADLDGDEDVDAHDVTAFVDCMSGSNQPADAGCVN